MTAEYTDFFPLNSNTITCNALWAYYRFGMILNVNAVRGMYVPSFLVQNEPIYHEKSMHSLKWYDHLEYVHLVQKHLIDNYSTWTNELAYINIHLDKNKHEEKLREIVL